MLEKFTVKQTRPARVQCEKHDLTSDDLAHQPGTVFNIWYRKWAGGDTDKALQNRRSPYRCRVSRDSGYTRADQRAGSYFCLYFARGMCYKGPKCEYLHRLPTSLDVFNQNVDCFGRDKFANYRDDMAGVGSFLRENRTLFVGYIKLPQGRLESLVRKSFQEWGKIDRVKALNNRNFAFVTFHNESNAQFAKEAMSHQTLTGKETLVVKWAAEDVTSESAAQDKLVMEKLAAETIQQVLSQDLQVDEPMEVSEDEEQISLISEKAMQKLRQHRLVEYSDSE